MRLIADTIENATNGKPLAGAVVTMNTGTVDSYFPITLYTTNDVAGPSVSSVTTDEDGYYEFYVPDGAYIFKATYGDIYKVVADFEVYDLSEMAAASAGTAETRLYGASSLARSNVARFGDTIDLREWLDKTGGASTDTANNIAMDALIDYLDLNPGKTLVGHKGDVYKISGTTQLVFPTGTKLRMDGGEFEWDGDLSGGASTKFQFDTLCDVEAFKCRILDGSDFRRFIDFIDQNKVTDFHLEAETQIANEGASPLLDYAVRYRGQAPIITRSKIINIDKAHFVYGDGGDGVPTLGARLTDLEAVSYVTGLNLRNQYDCRNRGYRAKTRSANATQDPGHNGLVHEGVARYVLSDYDVADAGEHGIRFGGTRNSEQASYIITVGPGNISRSGQTGLKFFTGTAGQTFVNTTITGVNVVDCQYEPENPSDLPGFNDEGILLQQMRNATVTGCSVALKDNPTGYSSDCCYFVTTSSDVLLQGNSGEYPYRNLLRIAEYDDGAGSAPVETTDSNSIHAIGMTGNAIREDGIYVDHPTQQIRDIYLSSPSLIGTSTTGKYACTVNAAAARYSQPCVFEVKGRNFAEGTFNVATSGNPNVHTRDLFSGTF
mgnify:CR=1 FL=1